MTTTGYDRVVEALDERGLLVGWTGNGSGRQSRCPGPSHHREDRRPSLSVSEGDEGKALVYCHGGCTTAEVVEALDLKMSDLFRDKEDGFIVARYEYQDENGNPLLRVIRRDPKGFFQERYDNGTWIPGVRNVRRVPYNLPAVIAADEVWVVEGEKDADNLSHRKGVTATTILGGAGKWKEEYQPYFTGKKVIIVADNDEVGKSSATQIKMGVLPVAKSVEVYLPKAGKDITDHLDAGYGLKELVPYGMPELDPFAPVDWEDYEVEETEWLMEPYVPRGSRVLAFGAAGSLKSLWAMWLAAHLTKEGKKVAYFALEMGLSDTVRRLRQLSIEKRNFHLYRKFNFSNPNHVALALDGLKGMDLIIVDSWSAAHQGTTNDEVARLDNEVFQPIIDATGATLLILDNTGHDVITEKGKIKPTHARGASAKGDKMEVTLQFDRPVDDNNYRTTISVRKMRMDRLIPAPETIETPRDRIEFYHVTHGMMTGTPFWPSLEVKVESQDVGAIPTPTSEAEVGNINPIIINESGSGGTSEGVEGSSPGEGQEQKGNAALLDSPLVELTPAERRAMARLRDTLGATIVSDNDAEVVS